MGPRLLIGALGILLALPAAAQQQDNSAQQKSSPPKSAQQKPDQQKGGQQKTGQASQPAKSTTDQNPFPQAQSEQAAHETQNPAPPPAAPAPGAKPAGSSTAAQNPFPEAESEKAAKQAQQQDSAAKPGNPAQNPAPPAGQDSSSSSVKGLNLGLRDVPASNGAGGTVLSPELGRKDTKVGDFYLQTGDYKGAYDRFAEATKVDPTNAEAVYGLAAAARHLNHPDEAIRNYQLYLSALPDGPRAKDARKALKELIRKP